MWFLSFIPDSVLQWFVHGVVAIGLVLTLGGSILSKIPVIKNYSGFFKLFGLPLLVAGVFFEGGYGTEMMWRKKVHEMEEKVKIAEQQSVAANKNLSQALINQKADVLLQNTDSTAVLQTAEKNGKYAFGWDSDMSAFAPKAHLGSAVVNWGPYYEKAVNDVLNGSWKTADTKWGTKEGANDLIKINRRINMCNT